MSLKSEIGRTFGVVGINVGSVARSLKGLSAFRRNKREYVRQHEASPTKEFPFGRDLPCLADRFDSSGVASGHYFHQDLWVAQRILANNPVKHVDVGSRVDGFVAHVAVFRAIEVFDIRPLLSTVPNITFSQADLMAADFPIRDYADSLSCLHTLEHFGLGRYGDPVMYDGYQRGWDNLHKILKPGGTFYFAVPIGPQRVEFDGHRIFSIPFLLKMIEGRYAIRRFAYVGDDGDIRIDAPLDSPEARESFGCRYGCGIFEMQKQ